MFELEIKDVEFYDEKSNRFFTVKGGILVLEHSLVSVSKWESKWKKPFISKTKLSRVESIDYIKCMTINQNAPDRLFTILSEDNFNSVVAYIDDPMTATTFYERGPGGGSTTVTSELIYYWMIVHNIPMECQKWHLNRLLTLIRVCNLKSQNKKMSKKEVLSNNRALNEQRRRQMGSRG